MTVPLPTVPRFLKQLVEVVSSSIRVTNVPLEQFSERICEPIMWTSSATLHVFCVAGFFFQQLPTFLFHEIYLQVQVQGAHSLGEVFLLPSSHGWRGVLGCTLNNDGTPTKPKYIWNRSCRLMLVGATQFLDRLLLLARSCGRSRSLFFFAHTHLSVIFSLLQVGGLSRACLLPL